ncbi:MAG: phosphate ABC transporter permease, partial [Pseudoalteromonas shioyasakiensis]
WRGKISEQAIDAFAVSPRANAVLSLSNNTLSIFEVHNEHPEVTWSALWNEVWYEGYPEPAYTWQSTSASDDF